MPHEPNVGFGRPNVNWWPGAALSWMDSTIGAPSEVCKQGEACKMVLKGGNNGGTYASNFATRGIAEARAEIEQAERERAAHAD
jgi:hypothetical protein